MKIPSPSSDPVAPGQAPGSQAGRRVSVLKALKWSFLSELAAKAIAPLVFVVLARFVTPVDFGVMAAALMAIHFSQIIWDAGMGKALVQRQDGAEAAASTALWINLTLGIAIATALALASGVVAEALFHDRRVALVLRVLSLQVVLGASSSVHIALFQRALAFKKLFWVRITTVGLPGLASIPLAWAGMGYWALVAGSLVGQLAQVIVLWTISNWRPTWAFDRAIAKELVRFGAWVETAGLLSWFFAWGDSLIVGMYLGSHELGLFRVGGQFAATAFSILLGPVSPVLYSFLCRMNGERAALRRAAERIVGTLTLVTLPLAMVIFSLASPISAALFGDKWRGVDAVIGVMALMHGFSWVVGMNGEVYRASGKPAFETIVTAGTLPIYLAAYIATARHGLQVFLWTRLLLALMALLAHLAVLRVLVQTPVVPLLVRIVLVTALVGIPSQLIAAMVRGRFSNPWIELVVAGTLIAGVAAAVVYAIGGRTKLREFLALRRGSEGGVA